MGRGEISWKGRNEEGIKREVYAQKTGDQWAFFEREKRYDVWQQVENPSLDDWTELLDGVRRRVSRRLLRPEDGERLKKTILERFPDAKLD